MEKILNLLSDININTISVYLEKITDLYIKPLKVWRKVISTEKESISTFIFYTIFFGLIIYLLNPNTIYVSRAIIGSLILNLYNVLVLSFPFLFFTRLWNQRIQLNRLYRLTYIFLLQVYPVRFIAMVVTNRSGVDNFFILSDNSMVVVDLLSICVIPVLSRISVLQKAIWIFANYACVITFLVLLKLNPFDMNTIIDKMEFKSPNSEFAACNRLYQGSDVMIDDRYYIIRYDSVRRRYFNPQYPSYYLLDTIQGYGNQLRRKIDRKYDEILKNRDVSKLEEGAFGQIKIKIPVPWTEEDFIPETLLDKYRTDYNKKFYRDLKLADSIQKFAKYKNNRRIFGEIYKMLIAYDSIYSDSASVNSAIRSIKKDNFNLIRVDDKSMLILVNIENTNKNKFIRAIKSDADKMYNAASERRELSIILSKWIYFPIYLFKDKRKPIGEEFNNIIVKSSHEN